MKVKKLLFFVSTLVCLCSCNTEDVLISEVSGCNSESLLRSTTISDSIDVEISQQADWAFLWSSDVNFYVSKDVSSYSDVRAYVDSRIVKSCHSCEPRSKDHTNMKVAYYDKELCAKMGITPGIYISDNCQALITLYTGEGEKFIPTDSPKCGLQPNGGGVRGYASSISGNTIVLTTYLTHVKYDMLGKPIDIWYPVHPNDLIWNYDIYLPHWN